MTPTELKLNVETKGNSPYYFSRATMRFFGDTMSNYRVRKGKVNGRAVYILIRKRPVKHGNQDPAYFDAENFDRVYVHEGDKVEGGGTITTGISSKVITGGDV